MPLVLTRRVGQEILIAGGIRIQVNRIWGQQVSLAVFAPADVRVMRAEIVEGHKGPSKEDARDGNGANRTFTAGGRDTPHLPARTESEGDNDASSGPRR